MANLNGYIKIHRKLLDWGWYTDNVVKIVFFHLMLTANFKEQQWRGRTILRGQLITSTAHLAAELGLSVQQVRTALKKLNSTGEITSETTNKYTLITIENWDKYQNCDDEATSNATDNATNEQQSNNKQITNNQQQRKNDKKDKKPLSEGEYRSDRLRSRSNASKSGKPYQAYACGCRGKASRRGGK